MTDLGICCFLSFCESRNPETTAQELSVSPSTVLRNIRKLEEEIGLPLFLGEITNGILTDTGMEFLNYFSEFMADMSRVNAVIHGAEKQNSLRVGWCEWTGCPDWLLRAVHNYQELHPELDIAVRQTSPADTLLYMERGETDVSIISRHLTHGIHEPFQSRVLQEIPLYCITAADGPYASMTPYELIHTAHAKLFISHAWNTDADVTATHFRRIFAKLGWHPPEIDILPNWDCAYLQARLGNGFSMAPLNNKIVTAGAVFRLSPLVTGVTLTVNQLIRNDKPHVTDFGRFLLEQSQEVTA